MDQSSDERLVQSDTIAILSESFRRDTNFQAVLPKIIKPTPRLRIRRGKQLSQHPYKLGAAVETRLLPIDCIFKRYSQKTRGGPHPTRKGIDK